MELDDQPQEHVAGDKVEDAVPAEELAAGEVQYVYVGDQLVPLDQVGYFDENGQFMYYQQEEYDEQFEQFGEFERMSELDGEVPNMAGDFDSMEDSGLPMISSGPADFDEFEQNFADFDEPQAPFEPTPAEEPSPPPTQPQPEDEPEPEDNSPALRAAPSLSDITAEGSSDSLVDRPRTDSTIAPSDAASKPVAAKKSAEDDEDGANFESLGPVDFSAPLSKQSQKNWKKRVGVLKGSLLYIFPNLGAKAVVAIKLQGYKLTPTPNLGFNIVKNNKSHIFSVETEEERSVWMHKIYLASLHPDDNFVTGPIGPIPARKMSGTLPRKGSMRSVASTPVASSPPSSASPASQIAGPKEIEVVVQRRNASQPLGMDIRVNMVDGVTVKSVLPDGAVEATGQIREGDRLLKINQQRLQGMTTEQVIRVLKTTSGDIVMTILRS